MKKACTNDTTWIARRDHGALLYESYISRAVAFYGYLMSHLIVRHRRCLPPNPAIPILYTMTTTLISYPPPPCPLWFNTRNSPSTAPAPAAIPLTATERCLKPAYLPSTNTLVSNAGGASHRNHPSKPTSARACMPIATTATSSPLRDGYTYYTCNRTPASQRRRHLPRHNSDAATVSAISKVERHSRIIFVVASYTDRGRGPTRRRRNENNKRRAIGERSARSAKELSRIRVRWGSI